MICIISNESDISTSHVIEWLIHYKVPFVRINGEDRFSLINFNLSKNSFSCIIKNIESNKIIEINSIKCLWYRRGGIKFVSNDSINFIPIKDFINSEYDVISDFIFKYFESLPRIDNYFKKNLNKLMLLHIASKNGLDIPDTILFEGKLPKFKDGKFVTKAIFETFQFVDSEDGFGTLTSEVDFNDANLFNIEYGISLLQTKIEKECDLRVYYLNGNFFTMAIMSQENDASKIDFRAYPADKPNRRFRFRLSEELKFKLTNIMKEVEINSGSIDLVFTKDGRYIFLEINPVGQFGMTSFPCNYNIEKEIALTLKNMYLTLI